MCNKCVTNFQMNNFKQIPNKTYQAAIIWLLVDMPLNITFNLNDTQQQIIIEIFTISGIKLAIKPEIWADYWYFVTDDWKKVTKMENKFFDYRKLENQKADIQNDPLKDIDTNKTRLLELDLKQHREK